MKIFCKLCFIVLLLTVNVYPGGAQSIDPAASNELALRATVINPADRAALAQRFLGVQALPLAPVDPPARQVGEIESFNVNNTETGSAGSINAELRAVGKTVYVWVQSGMPVTDEAAQTFADVFDTHIYEPVTRLWNVVPPGVDGDPRIYALFTTGLDSNVAAYFSSENMYPAAIRPGSNEHEMLIFNLVVTTVEINHPDVYGVAAHELQHLIRTLLQPATPSWLDEAFATFTSDAVGYAVNPGYVLEFAAAPDVSLIVKRPVGNRPASYGAGLLFMSYFHQRYGEAGLQAISQTSNAGDRAIDAWLKQQGEPRFDALFADFVLANIVLDAPAGYGYAGVWNDRDLLPAAVDRTMRAYPASIGSVLPQYGSDYYDLPVPAGDALTIDLTMPETVPLLTPGFEAADGAFFYAIPVDETDAMLTRAFDLTGVTQAALHYRVWYALESFWDYGYLSISVDEGLTWQILHAPDSTRENPFFKAYGSGYTGTAPWQEQVVALDAYAGQKVLLRFEMITDDATLEPGMAIDDIRIPEINYSEDFETGSGGWEAAGWARITDAIPQPVFVQVVQRMGDEISVTRWQSIGSNSWTLPLESGVESVTLAVSPVAPFTLQSTAYSLRVAQKS